MLLMVGDVPIDNMTSVVTSSVARICQLSFWRCLQGQNCVRVLMEWVCVRVYKYMGCVLKKEHELHAADCLSADEWNITV